MFASVEVDLIFEVSGRRVGVKQDQRGTHKSKGKFDEWVSAPNDAYDTMKWISEQPWCNGDIYSIGASADGINALTEIKRHPPWLKGEWIIWSAYRGYPIIFPGGAYRKSLADHWMKSTVPSEATYLIADIRANEAPGVYVASLSSRVKHKLAPAHVHVVDCMK